MVRHCQCFQEVFPILTSGYDIDCHHVVGHPCKLQFDHCISSVGCGQGSLAMLKVCENNE